MTTTWQIAQIKRTPDTELVFEVVYIMNFLYEGESDRHVGTVTLQGDPASEGFIPFDQLTKEIVEQWVKDKLGIEAIAQEEEAALLTLQKTINKKNNPEFLTGMPWSN